MVASDKMFKAALLVMCKTLEGFCAQVKQKLFRHAVEAVASIT